MKLKVLLVDDELLIRLGIKSIIDWERHGFVYIGDAPDGAKALEMIERERPHILLTDIVMPHMDGLELIEVVKVRYPHVRIIVLSSHNEYDYLRAAMKLGVQDYLLKASMKPEELLELLLEMAAGIRADHNGHSGQAEAAVAESGQDQVEWLHRMLLEDSGSRQGSGQKATEQAAPIGMESRGRRRERELYLNQLLAKDCRLMLLRIHDSGPKATDLQMNRTTLYNLLELELNKWGIGCVIPYEDNEWVVLLPEKESRTEQRGLSGQAESGEAGQGRGAKQAQLIGHDLISAARRFLNVSISIGISSHFLGESQVRSAYCEAERALQLYFVDGKERVYMYEEIALVEGESAPYGMTKDEVRRLQAELAQFNEEGAVVVIHDVFERMREARSPIDRSIQACLQLLHVIQYESPREGSPLYKQVVEFEQLAEARDWFVQLVRDSIVRARQMLRESHRTEITQLIIYMSAHYKQDLSLKKAARIVNMSENYLSHLFKKEMNISFTEYLNKLRIEKAAQLLLETDLPSYRIAEEVGYENNNYFGRVFKKLKGISPQQYRSEHQR